MLGYGGGDFVECELITSPIPYDASMPRLLVGTAGFTDPERDFAALDLVELHVGRDRRTPSLADAKAWRHAAPDAFTFLLRADIDVRQSPDSPKLARQWKAIAELALALDARLVTVPTPSSFRATDANRAHVQAFFPWAHRAGLRLAWEPRNGHWPRDVLTDLCRELTLTHVVDPLHASPVRGRPPCFRLNGEGGPGHEYTESELDRIRARLDEFARTNEMYDRDEALVVFGNARRVDDAARLRGASFR